MAYGTEAYGDAEYADGPADGVPSGLTGLVSPTGLAGVVSPTAKEGTA